MAGYDNCVKTRLPRKKARRSYAAEAGPGNDPEAWRRSLCAVFFNDPGRIASAMSHGITGSFHIDRHHHADLLQLDLIHRCRGEAEIDGKAYSLADTTLLVSPPGQSHGYTLRPQSRQSAVWLVKFRVGRSHPAPLPAVITGLTQVDDLHAALADFVRSWTPEGVGVFALCRLAQAVAMWPSSPGSVAAAPPPRDTSTGPVQHDGARGRVRRAIEKLSARLDDPPPLEELAEAARMSPRHFSRRFREDFGCTPHDYIQARRLDAARGLLRDADRRVSDVAAELGFSSPAAFSRWFVRLTGSSPRRFRDEPHNY